ncbi:MAG TPA: SPOR domain-containing protein [Burkholderiales bacterium]|nr:SPOR domain-containing protein [Burkholderiales bacterium]
MRLTIGLALLALALGASGVATAQSKAKSNSSRAVPLATVELVQASAAVERGRIVAPLAPGSELNNGDRINTGARSRVILKFADGSTMQLGEQGSFFFDRMGVRGDGVFEAAIFVAEGTFRFTTGALEKFAGKREVSIAVNTVNVGVRGADLWGKSTSQSQIVCLVAGSVEVTPPNESPLTLSQPMSFYTLEGTVSRAVATVLADQFRAWAAETEAQPGQGVASRGGKWKVTVASGKKFAEALDVYNEMRKTGYAAEVAPEKLKDQRVYSVRLANFETKKDAETIAADLKRDAGLAKYQYKVGP